MSLLQMISTITEISQENHATLVVKIVNHASRCYAQSRLTRLMDRITHHADNLGPITRHGKPFCHPE